MAFVLRTAKKIRNNWKKSTFAAIILTCGYNYAADYLQTQQLMRAYCESAVKFGNQTIPVDVKPKSITVILNPNANKRKAADEFEKFCAPLLHLSGVYVNIIKTEFEGHAKKLVEDLSNTDAIIVAGGDGTLCEVVTGLLRRTEENTSGLVPIGILPLGRTNSLGKVLFPGGKHLEKVRTLADATMAVIEEVTKPMDIMKIEIAEEINDSESKPIYALAGIKWGAYRDAQNIQDRYWYFGSLRKYATYLFNGYKNSLTWNVSAEITYSPPCKGCQNCLTKHNNHPQNQKWFQRYAREKSTNELTKSINPYCETTQSKHVDTIDLTLSTSNLLSKTDDIPKLYLNIGPKQIDYTEFVRQGWEFENGKERKFNELIDARQIEITPNIAPDKEGWFTIDNDNFEVKPVKITLLPNFINMYCKKESILR